MILYQISLHCFSFLYNIWYKKWHLVASLQTKRQVKYKLHYTSLDVWLCSISTSNKFYIMVSILWMTSFNFLFIWILKHPQMQYSTVVDTTANYAFRTGIALACKYLECLHEVSLLDAALFHIALAKAFLSLYICGILFKTSR